MRHFAQTHHPPGTEVGTRVLASAQAFEATLRPDQLTQLHQPYTAATIRAWSNFPQATLKHRRRRVGLSTATLSATQWAALDTLLATATGPGNDSGFARIRQHLDADDHLRELGDRHGYGRDHFVVAFLNPPSATGIWELQFGGHHLAVAHTYLDGVLIGATPAFRGIEPAAAFEHNGEVLEPERRSWRALAVALACLDRGQTREAKLPGRNDDLLLGPGCDWKFPARAKGLPGSRLTPAQRDLLLEAISSYVEDVDAASATRILARYDAELDTTCLGWTGSTTLDRPGDYLRIDGPSVWIELSVHDGIVLSAPHPHSVWRDKVTDYGGTRF